MLAKSGSNSGNAHDENKNQNTQSVNSQNSLFEARKGRQKLQEEAQQLENRVSKLEKEKVRVLKNIEEMKKKGTQLVSAKNYASEDQSVREKRDQNRKSLLEQNQQLINDIRTSHAETMALSRYHNDTPALITARQSKVEIAVI